MLEMLGNDVFVAEIARQGVWAILYVATILYTLHEARRQGQIASQREERMREENIQIRNESRERENKLTTFITEITKQFERLATGVERLTMDVDEIKDELKLRRLHRKINDDIKKGDD